MKTLKEKIILVITLLIILASFILMMLSQATGNPIFANIGSIMFASFAVIVMCGIVIWIIMG